MFVKTFCWLALGLYVTLSAVDFVFTFALIRLSDGMVYESNPIAAAFLDRHGWLGLAAFKLAGVLVFVVAVSMVMVRKRWVGAAVAAFGCGVLISVVSYSHQMLQEARHEIATRNAGWGAPPPDPLQEPYLGLFAER
jgi:hypothetical protein